MDDSSKSEDPQTFRETCPACLGACVVPSPSKFGKVICLICQGQGVIAIDFFLDIAAHLGRSTLELKADIGDPWTDDDGTPA